LVTNDHNTRDLEAFNPGLLDFVDEIDESSLILSKRPKRGVALFLGPGCVFPIANQLNKRINKAMKHPHFDHDHRFYYRILLGVSTTNELKRRGWSQCAIQIERYGAKLALQLIEMQTLT
jgi:hypothetical protein